MAFQCRVRSDINTCAADVSSKTVWSPQILGRYLLGGTSSGPQIKAARKPSNCSKFIERLSPKRSRTALRSSTSVWVSGCDFMEQPRYWLTRRVATTQRNNHDHPLRRSGGNLRKNRLQGMAHIDAIVDQPVARRSSNFFCPSSTSPLRCGAQRACLLVSDGPG